MKGLTAVSPFSLIARSVICPTSPPFLSPPTSPLAHQPHRSSAAQRLRTWVTSTLTPHPPAMPPLHRPQTLPPSLPCPLRTLSHSRSLSLTHFGSFPIPRTLESPRQWRLLKGYAPKELISSDSPMVSRRSLSQFAIGSITYQEGRD